MIDRYTPQIMKELWSQSAKYSRWLKVELAVMQAYEEKGIIPSGTFAKAKKKCPLGCG